MLYFSLSTYSVDVVARILPEIPTEFHQSDRCQQSGRAIKPAGLLRLAQAEPCQFHFGSAVQPERVDLSFAQIEIDVDLAAEARFTVVSDFQDQFLVACRVHQEPTEPTKWRT